jgi:hypothetical protein
MKFYSLRRFDGGLNNAFADHMLLDNQAADILNFDLTTRGNIRVRNGFSRLNTSALRDISARTSATFSAYGPSAFYVSGGVAYVGTSAGTSATPTSATSASLWLFPSAAASFYVPVGGSKPVRGLTRFYNTSGTNPWVACCSGRVHFGTASLSSYLTQTFTVDADMEFTVFRDTLLIVNGVEKFKSRLRSASDSSAWANAPIMNTVISWQDRLWGVPTASAYVVRHTSAIGSTEGWDAASFFTVGKQDGGDILALAVLFGNLVILKTTGIYVLAGTTPENYQLDRMSQHGCISRRSVEVGDTGIIYLAPDGVRIFDGINSILLSETEQFKVKIIGDINMNKVNNAAGVYFDRKYILAYDDVGAGEVRNNRAFVFNFLTGTWTKYTLPANALFKTLGSNESLDLYFGSSVSGFVYKMFTGTTDDGVGATSATKAISANYKTKGFDFSDRFNDLATTEKQFRKVIVKGSVASSYIGVSAEVDAGAGITRSWSIDSQAIASFILGTDDAVLGISRLGGGIATLSNEQSLPVRAKGKTISLKITSNRKSQETEINAVSFGYRRRRVRG